MAYVNAACAGRVAIFSTGGKFCPVSNFMLLRSYSSRPFLCALGHYSSYIVAPMYFFKIWGPRVPNLGVTLQVQVALGSISDLA